MQDIIPIILSFYEEYYFFMGLNCKFHKLNHLITVIQFTQHHLIFI